MLTRLLCGYCRVTLLPLIPTVSFDTDQKGSCNHLSRCVSHSTQNQRLGTQTKVIVAGKGTRTLRDRPLDLTLLSVYGGHRRMHPRAPKTPGSISILRQFISSRPWRSLELMGGHLHGSLGIHLGSGPFSDSTFFVGRIIRFGNARLST